MTPDDRPAKIRAFLALDLTDELRGKTADLLRRLQTGAKFTAAHPKWVDPAGVHLTLKFLGQIDDAPRAAITGAVRAVAPRHRPFTVQLRGLGVFPSARAPRVIWLGVKKAKPLLALQEDIEAATSKAGFSPADQEFSPHLTLARLRHLKGSQPLMDVIRSHSHWDLGAWPVNEVILFESTLHPSGAIHTPLERFPLGGS